MEFDYLLALQDLRESAPEAVEQFFAHVSLIGEGPLLVAVVLVLYWCVDKRAGQFAMLGICLANFAGQLLKTIACVYRPWILDSRIDPSDYAIAGATGYSFPSGHTVGTTAVCGGLAWFYRRKHALLGAFLVAFVVLMMLSRNLLGVHTPQDVLAGLLVGVVGIAAAQGLFRMFKHLDARNPHHRIDVLAAILAVAIAIAGVVFAEMKPYPLDYVDGTLLVDPVAMRKDFIQSAGLLIGASLGWLLERRFVQFATPQTLTISQRAVRLVASLCVVAVAYFAADFGFKALLEYNWAKLCSLSILAFSALFVAPATFTAIEKRVTPDVPSKLTYTKR